MQSLVQPASQALELGFRPLAHVEEFRIGPRHDAPVISNEEPACHCVDVVPAAIEERLAREVERPHMGMRHEALRLHEVVRVELSERLDRVLAEVEAAVRRLA